MRVLAQATRAFLLVRIAQWFILGVLVLLIASQPARVSAATCSVPSTTYATIQSAINDVNCTDINVAAGTYTENLVINRAVTINGATGQGTILDGGGAGQVVQIMGANVDINSVVIRNGKTSANGGGVYNQGGSLLLYGSTVTNNEAGYGGAIENFGQVILQYDTISNNTATTGCGGGIDNPSNSATLYLFFTTVSTNHATHLLSGNGGGICSSGTASLTNSTVSTNTAVVSGGGIFNSATGSIVNLYNVTISDNVADSDQNGVGKGGGVYNLVGAIFNFKNSLLALNLQGTASDDCFGTLNSQDYNLIYYPTCTISGNLAHNIVSQNPLLGALQNNGGATQTHALLAGSPAIDAGNPTGCTDANNLVLTTDQRGLPRPYPAGGRCDIGAFEFSGYKLLLPLILK